VAAAQHITGGKVAAIGIVNANAVKIVVVAIAVDQHNGDLRRFHLLIKLVGVHADHNNAVKVAFLRECQVTFIDIGGRNNYVVALPARIIFNAAHNFTVKAVLQHQAAAGLGLWHHDADQLGIAAGQAACA